LSSACLILNNSAGPLLVEDAVAALPALDNISRLQRVLSSTISAQVADGFRLLRVHPSGEPRELETRVCLSCGREGGIGDGAAAERDGGKEGRRTRRSSVCGWADCLSWPNWRTQVTSSSGPRSKFTGLV